MARKVGIGRKQKRIKDLHNPSLLNDVTEEIICRNIARGLRYDDAAYLAGIARATFYLWCQRGKDYPESRYGQFQRRMEAAKLESKATLVHAIARDPDWRAKRWMLECRFPEEFPRTMHLRQELSGPDGEAIPVAFNPFEVKIVLSGEDEKFIELDYRDRLNGTS